MNKNYKVKVDNLIVEFEDSHVTGENILSKVNKEPAECYWLYLKLKGCDFERIRSDEKVDLSNPGIEEFITKETEVYNYTVSGEPETTDRKQLTPTEILKLAGIDPADNYLVQVLNNGLEIIYADCMEEPITMVCPTMTFISREWLDVVDVEEYGKQCKPVPSARKYKIKVDKDYYVVDRVKISGNELLQLANKNPVDKYDVFKLLSGQPKPVKIAPNEYVMLNEKCLLRFVTLPKEQTDGSEPRRQFLLPADDIDALNKMGLLWETLSQGNWLLIHDYKFPEGYNTETGTVALLIPPMYPSIEIDMAYFYPTLQKKSGHGINATTTTSIDGKIFQRWSRHRRPGDWRLGIDNIATHLTLVDNWLVNDLKR